MLKVNVSMLVFGKPHLSEGDALQMQEEALFGSFGAFVLRF